MAFSRAEKSRTKVTGPGKVLKICSTQLKNMKCMEGSKEN